jgi:hypothetical protein
MKKFLIAGNWKMNKLTSEAVEFAKALKELDLPNASDAAILAPFTQLNDLGRALEGSGVGFGAQNVHFEPSGAFTGEISVPMLKEIGVDYVVPHVGQVWWFGDTSFEILYTLDIYLPKVANAFNTSSIIFRSATPDASGKETTAIITGDATGHAFTICNKLYGKDLKCDIMQVAHHGGGTGGASGETQAAYVHMQPSVIFWPVGANHFATVKANSYNHVLLEGKNPNYAELYVAGWQGNTVTLPLPYTIGTAITNNIVEPK